MKKKGDVKTMQVVIVAVLVLLLLLIPSTNLASFFTSSGNIGKCQASILKAYLIDSTTAGVGSNAAALLGAKINALKCNDLPDVIIKKNEVMQSGKIKDSAVKRQIADAMIECLKMTGQGRIDPFGKYTGDQAYCLLCADVIFEESFVKEMKEENYKVTDMNYWFATNTAPEVKETYFKVLYGTEPTREMINQYKGMEAPLDAEQQYAIVWRLDADKKGKAETLFGLSAGTLTGATGGAAAFIFASSLAATKGSAAGAIIGSVVPGIGTAVGAVVGAAVGFTAGAAGGLAVSYVISETLAKDEIVSSGIYLIPKSQLGEKFELSEWKEEPFCTKLVNY